MKFWRRDDRRSVGKRGEDAAARFLTKRGFVIVERNVRSRLGEIDLVARDRETLVFIEVKCRREPMGDPPRRGWGKAPEKLGYLVEQRS